jgi:hypothetical protein
MRPPPLVQIGTVASCLAAGSAYSEEVFAGATNATRH